VGRSDGEKAITSSSDTTSQTAIPVFESKFLYTTHIFIVIYKPMHAPRV